MKLLDNWAAIIGFLIAIAMFYRMNLSMEQEFSDQEEIVKDPLAYAVRTTVTFGELQANNWKAFDALVMAIRFRTFYQRFRLLVDPLYSKICVLLMLGIFITLIIFAQLAKSDPKINNIIGGAFAVIIGFWWVVVDHGKALKKSVDKLRVT